MINDIRIEEHWIQEDFKQRITIKQLRELLINCQDKIIFHGRVRLLINKNVGVGIYEIYKKKLPKERKI